MQRDWHHGHSLAAGIAGGILLTSHSWLLVAAGLVAGWLARDLYAMGRWTARAVARKVEKPTSKWAGRG